MHTWLNRSISRLSHLCYARVMAEIPLRELRNNTSDVLRRVEAGEEMTVTISGRPVAQIVPLQRRRPYLTFDEILANQTDPGFADDLREIRGDDTMSDMEDPWEKAARR